MTDRRPVIPLLPRAQITATRLDIIISVVIYDFGNGVQVTSVFVQREPLIAVLIMTIEVHA